MQSSSLSLSLVESLGSNISNKEKRIVPQEDVCEWDHSEETQMEDSGIHTDVDLITDADLFGDPRTDATVENEADTTEETQEGKQEETQGKTHDDGNTIAVDEVDSALNNLHIAERVTPKTFVIISSTDADDEANRAILTQSIANVGEVDVKICNEESDFNISCLSSTVFKTMFIIVDSKICDIMMKKRKLRDSVDDFFEEFTKASEVFLVNRLPEDEQVRYVRLKTQLPECVKEYKEITVTAEQNNTQENSSDESEVGNDGDEFGYHGHGEASGGRVEVPTDKVTQSNIQLDGDQTYVIVGSQCTMNIQKSLELLGDISIKQEGYQNIINVQIVPAATTSKLVVVIRTDPSNLGLERELIQEINEELQVINLCLKHFGGSIVDIKKGSIVIEIDVEPGITMGHVWLKDILNAIFSKPVASRIPKGTGLHLMADVKNVIPVSKLLEYFSEVSETRGKEDIHKNCVDREKYEILLEEHEDLKRRLNVVTVSVVTGNITEEKSEVIVNSTNPNLILSDGAVSKEILDAAGNGVQDECSMFYKSGVKVGDLAVTGGGNLSCKNIYHITLSDGWSVNQDNAEKSLRGVLVKCLQKADESGHRSISIPALGTGKLNYDPERVAEIMYDVCLSFKSSGLTDVRLVVHPSCSNVHRVFADVNRRNIRKGFERSQSVPGISAYPPWPELKKSKSLPPIPDIPRKIQVNWLKGDISKQKVDVVVNSTVSKLTLSSGPLSKAVLMAAGNDIQEECYTNYPDGIKEGGVAYTSGGKMSWNHIYHAVLWPWNDTPSMEKNYKELIGDCLLRASESDQHSIAFPLLGAGVLHYPPEKVAQWVSDAIEEFQLTNPGSNVCQVNIVVHPKDTASIDALKRQAKF